MMLLELSQLNIPPGDRVILTDLSWQEYEQILEEYRSFRRLNENKITKRSHFPKVTLLLF
jgi:hypothetical protein